MIPQFKKSLLGVALLASMALASSAPLKTIAVGSCANQWIPNHAWQKIEGHNPDLMVMMGDNVYTDYHPSDETPIDQEAWEENPFSKKQMPADEQAMERVFKQVYGMLAADKNFQSLRAKTPFIATWDDHDFGRNDVGMEFKYKELSRRIFLEFWDEPKGTPRWNQKDGIYTAYYYGPEEKRIQVIMLDNRFQRTAEYKLPHEDYQKRYNSLNLGDYLANPGREARMLGDEQWAWLERELQKPAKLRIIVSSLQILAEFTGWEAWSLFPLERERLFKVIERSGAEGVILASGDVHYGEIVKLDRKGDYPLYEITASGLNQGWPKIPANEHRIGNYYDKANFGLIKVDWELPDPQITFEIRSDKDALILQHTFKLSDLHHP